MYVNFVSCVFFGLCQKWEGIVKCDGINVYAYTEKQLWANRKTGHKRKTIQKTHNTHEHTRTQKKTRKRNKYNTLNMYD